MEQQVPARHWPALLAAAALSTLGWASGGAADVDFNRDIRPVLINRCYRCHSSLKQESGLRLDLPEALLKGGDGGPVLVPGRGGESRLVQSIEQSGDLKMPPEGDPLPPATIALIRRWIDEGAHVPTGEQARHWSFVTPQRRTPPTTSQPAWPTTEIDSWIAARLDAAGLTPSRPAPRHVLLRRLTLDLIGLPPGVDDEAEYLVNDDPDATERLVDRLLADPRYGERWGRHWMDVWRYSDWDGYGAEVRESQPHIWRWRDWIIQALNGDKPYNRMIVEMLAGDELAPDDPDTLRATGFLVRNWFKFNRNVWLDNTIEHTGKAFVGLTFNCARCHDHMYDPMSQHEYYQLRAIFEPYDVRTDPLPGQSDVTKDGLVRAYDANAGAPTFVFTRGDEKQPEKERPIGIGLPKSLLASPLTAQPVALSPWAYYPGARDYVQSQAAADAAREVAQAETALNAARGALADADQKLRQFAVASQGTEPPAGKPGEKAMPTEIFRDDFAQPRPELWTFGPGKWEQRDGRLFQLEPLDTYCHAIAAAPHPRDFQATFRFRTTGGKIYKSVGLSFDLTGDKDFQSVYLSAYAAGPKLQFAWRQNGQDTYPAEAARAIVVELNRAYELQITVRDQLLNATIDGQNMLAARLPAPRVSAGKLALWTYDATAEFLNVRLTQVPADFKFVEPAAGGAAAAVMPDTESGLQRRLARAQAAVVDAEAGVAVAQANAAWVAARMAADRAQYGPTPAANAKDLALAAGQAERQLAVRKAERATQQAREKLAVAREQAKPDDEKSKKAVTDAEAALATQEKALTEATQAAGQPLENYTRFGTVYAASSSGRRLALANWIAANDNPLTPRVAVNQIWLRHFGSPLVASMFDFGANGKRPSHPELMDALAHLLVEDGWQMKRLHRQLVTSAVYQQTSQAAESAAHNRPDPENTLYGRMNVRRMEAEIVRDATLFVSGQLDATMYGPDLDPAAGLTLPRRSIYFRNSKEKKMTFLSLFDSPNVTECYRRSESVAPQQALAMANSGLSLAQARILAGQLTAASGGAAAEATDVAFVAAAFQRILNRPASAAELDECQKFLVAQTARLRAGSGLTPFGGPSDVAVKAATDPSQRARENLVHVLLNHNDFVAIR